MTAPPLARALRALFDVHIWTWFVTYIPYSSSLSRQTASISPGTISLSLLKLPQRPALAHLVHRVDFFTRSISLDHSTALHSLRSFFSYSAGPDYGHIHEAGLFEGS